MIFDIVLQVPIIIGGTKDEGALFMPQFLNEPQLLDWVNADPEEQGPII